MKRNQAAGASTGKDVCEPVLLLATNGPGPSFSGQPVPLDSGRLFRSLDRVTKDGFALLSGGWVVEANAKIMDCLGLKRDELVGRDLFALSPPTQPGGGDSPVLARRFLVSAERGEPQSFEWVFAAGNGAAVETDVLLNPVSTGDGVVIQAIVQDLTRLKRVEAMLSSTQEELAMAVAMKVRELKKVNEVLEKEIQERNKIEKELLHARKMEAVGTLAGGLAHDFNNLLMGIQGQVSLMLWETTEEHPHFRKLRNIEAQIKSGTELTRQLLGVSRGRLSEKKPTDLNQVIEKILELFSRTHKNIVICTRLEEILWTVEADAGQIEQTLLNLYVNACQAMPFGGELHLESANVLLADLDVRPYGIAPGRYVRIQVRDTGIGMDEDVLQRAFDPFFTTKEKGLGTGLGLSMAYDIIRGHDGILQAHSSPGQGATFTIHLPASDAPPAPRETSADLCRNGGAGTVLVIDDEPIVLEVIEAMLRKLGYCVRMMSNPREAIAFFRENSDRIDLVILDMILPVMGGDVIYRHLRSIREDVKVMLMSGYGGEGKVAPILESGVCSFLPKPFTIQQLSDRMRRVLDDEG
jgi:PAS domain S-box-containing protein